MDELENVLAIPREEVILASAKDGTGVAEILEAIVARIPPPKGDPAKPAPGPDLRQPLRRLQGRRSSTSGSPQGTLHDHDAIRLMGSRRRGRAARARRLPAAARARSSSSSPARSATSRPGSRASARPRSATRSRPPPRPAAEPLPGYQPAKSLVFAGHLPGQRRGLPAPARGAREAPPQRRELHLRAGELGRARASGSAAGSWACSTWRSSRSASSASSTSTSSPRRRRSSTTSSCTHGRGTVVVDNPALLPEPGRHRGDRGAVGQAQRRHAEPVHRAADGALDQPARRPSWTWSTSTRPRVVLHFEMPLAELIVDYFDQLKSRSQGYASMDYEELGYRAGQPRQGRHPRQRRAGRRAVASSSTATGPSRSGASWPSGSRS